MRYSGRASLPSTFRNNPIGRIGSLLSRNATARLPKAAAPKPISSEEVFKKMMGRPFIREKYQKEMKSLAAHASKAETEAQRKFLKDYYERKKNIKEFDLKKEIRGAYEVAAEQGFEKKFETGTIGEKVARLAKGIKKEHAPPPPKVDENAERMSALRTVQAQAHKSYFDTQPAATMQQPTPLPKSSASGWATSRTSTGSSEASPASPKAASFAPFMGGSLFSSINAADKNDPTKQSLGEPKIVPHNPTLNPSTSFTGGRITQPRTEPRQPFSVVPGIGIQEDSRPVSSEPTPPPPAPPPSSDPRTLPPESGQ